MKETHDFFESLYEGLAESTKTSGVTVYGINKMANAFEPLFHMPDRKEAEQIVKKLCSSCEVLDCPDMKRTIQACYNIIEHG